MSLLSPLPRRRGVVLKARLLTHPHSPQSARESGRMAEATEIRRAAVRVEARRRGRAARRGRDMLGNM